MADVFIALGSNTGNRLEFLLRAMRLLAEKTVLQEVGGLYESAAYGLTGQPDFYNSAVRTVTDLSPEALLKTLKKMEADVGRIQRQRWGPREIDLDIIFYNQQLLTADGLQIPHPDFQNRRFVLLPLADIAPGFISPAHRRTVSDLLNNCPDSTEIELVARNWYPDGIKL